ncbi:unnamed protein product [Clonostachys solani]|uniref:Uncharacterized protein n=1 Tax=Clonostachys solani TaxID=160281 RepID=A0A9N9ZH57_9HYPO|nr:unnamed protein product [Clonostachys solani]
MKTDICRIIENTDRDIAITQRLERMQDQLSYIVKDTETSKHTLTARLEALPSSISEKLQGKLTGVFHLFQNIKLFRRS